MPRKIFYQLKDGFPRFKTAMIVLCAAAYLFLIRVSGASLWGLFLFAVCTAFYLYFPGRFFAKITGMEKALPQYSAPLGILLGTGFLSVMYCFCMRLGFLWVMRIVPPVLGVFWLLILNKEIMKPRKAWEMIRKDGSMLSRITLWSVLVVLATLIIGVKNAHPAVVGDMILTQDVMWNIGNANSFTLAFPPQDIRFSMVRFAYHYLTEIVMASLSIVSGVSCYDIYVFYAAPFVLGALLCCLHALGMCFYHGHKNKALLFTFSMFLFNCASLWTAALNGTGIFSNTNMMHLITNINSQSTALIFISIFVILFAEMTRKHFDVSWMYILVFLGNFVLVSFAKGPAAAIVVCSFLITMLFELFRKPKWGKMLVSFTGVLLSFAGIYALVFASGAGTSVHFGFKTLELSPAHLWLVDLMHDKAGIFGLIIGAIAHTFCMQPLQLPFYLKGLGKDLRGLWKLPAERLLANGVIAGGWLAYYLFWHPSYSQLYFALIAIFFMNLLAVDQVDKIRLKSSKAMFRVCGAVGLATTAVMVFNYTGSGARQLARNLAIIPKYPYVSTARAGDEEAMIWMRENTPETALFATNRIHSMSNRDDGISSLYTAMGSRQAFMEGYTYAITNMGVSAQVVSEKQLINRRLFSADTPREQILSLCRENNITHLVYSKQYAGDTSQLADFPVVYENADVTIYAAE